MLGDSGLTELLSDIFALFSVIGQTNSLMYNKWQSKYTFYNIFLCTGKRTDYCV